MPEKQAFVLCSGGLDSTITAHTVSKRRYSKIILLFFNYGQNSLEEERTASQYCAKSIGADFMEINLPELKNIAQGAMTGENNVKISKSLKDTTQESQSWYVPCRNLVFLNYALALAEKTYVEKKTVTDIFVGFKSEGKEPFPDATQAFLDKFNALSAECCAYPFKTYAPLIEKDKEDIVILGQDLKVDLFKTFSCYSSRDGKHCGLCLACRLRKAGFHWANVEDKTNYIT